ncbi:MAG: YfhO family protein [Oscillospiraceae bacterium]|nr:YfhO family protein [Oscillospiraceae bacterium]
MSLNEKIPAGKKYYWAAFAAGLFIFLIAAIPFAIENNGIFFFYGDFNAQQIPFTLYMTENISEFKFPQYDFSAGTGLDYFNAYSFYNMFSPFTLLTALIPEAVRLYAYTFVIALKFGVCAVSSYHYAKRFCTKNETALIAALLYTFSGSQMVNFIYHYLDGFALFPFLLSSLEEAVTEKKRGIFGITVAVCALTNYYIFGTAVVFIVLYFLVRLTDSRFRINFKDFLCLGTESVLGVLAAGIVIIPAAAMLLNSPKYDAGFGSIAEMLAYETPWRYPRIVQSYFMAPDLMGYTNFFPDYKGEYPLGSRFSSLSIFIPFFGMSGVFAFVSANRKSWQTKLIAICITASFIPVLNSLFSMGSPLYYARWMFAPTLIMAVMTACALENEPKHFRIGLIVNAAVVILIMLFDIIFPMEELTRWQSGAYYSLIQNWVQVGFTLAGLGITALILFKMKRDESFYQKIMVLTIMFVFSFTEITLLFGIGETAIPSSTIASFTQQPEFEEKEYGSRIALSESYFNRNLLWNQNSIYTFNSAVNPYVEEYLNYLDVTNAKMVSCYPLCCLLSVDEFVTISPKNTIIKGFPDEAAYSRDSGKYIIFAPNDFIPMGFCYDYCVSESDWLTLPIEERGKFALKAMIVNDTSSVSDYLEVIGKEEITSLSTEEFSEECRKRAEYSAHNYITSDDTASAEITLDKPELVFFSIAYDENFTAYVDGKKTEIINANVGFMAVPVPEGTHTIELVYHSDIRTAGIFASITGIAGLVIYAVIIKITIQKNKAN